MGKRRREDRMIRTIVKRDDVTKFAGGRGGRCTLTLSCGHILKGHVWREIVTHTRSAFCPGCPVEGDPLPPGAVVQAGQFADEAAMVWRGKERRDAERNR